MTFYSRKSNLYEVTLPSFLTRADKPAGACAPLKRMQAALSDHTGVLLRYAQQLVRTYEKNGLRPDPHWYDQRTAYAAPPPNPTPAPAAPKATVRTGTKIGGAITAAAKALCGLLDEIAPLAPLPHSRSEFGPDKDQKYWRSADYG